MKKRVILLMAIFMAFLCVESGFAQVSTVVPPLPEPGRVHAPANSPVAKHGRLRVSGNRLIDENNNPVTLRGMSFFWSNSDHSVWYKDDVVGWLVHDWKVSVVRAAMGTWNEPNGANNRGYADGDSSNQVNRVRTIVEAAIKRGVYVIIDWHAHDIPQTIQSGSGTINLRDKWRVFFEDMARTYGAYPNIIYEIFNEPTDSWNNIVAISQPIVNAIRAIDPHNVIVLGNPGHSSNPQQTGTAYTGSHLAHAMHFYAVSHNSYQSRLTEAINAGRAVFATEWGTTHYDGGQGGQNANISTDNSTSWIDLMEKNYVSWVNWNVSNKDEASSIFRTSVLTSQSPNWGVNNTTPALTNSGTYVRNKIRQYNDTAYVRPTTYTINTTTSGQGTVGRSANGPYGFNSSITLTATPAQGWEFVGWSGDAMGVNPSLGVKVVGINLNINANFLQSSMIRNGHFTSNIVGWDRGSTGTGVITIDHGTVDGGGVLVANVTNGGSSVSDARVRQNQINLQTGRRYELSFRARTQSGSRTLNVRMSNSNGDRNYMEQLPAPLTAQWQPFTRTFNMCFTTTAGVLVSDANAQLIFECGGATGTWYLDDVALNDVGPATPVCGNTSVASFSLMQRTSWSISQASGNIQLRGPAEVGARVTLYDTRGRVIRSMAAQDGMTLSRSSGIPSGNYLLVVKNSAGREVLKTRVLMAR